MERGNDVGGVEVDPAAIPMAEAEFILSGGNGVMNEASKVLTKNDVMDGVWDLVPNVQVEAIFTDGSRLVTVHDPIK